MGNKLTIGSIKHSFFNDSVSKKTLLFNHSSFDFDQLKNEYGILYQLFSSQDELFKNPEVMSYLYYLNNLMSFYYQCDYVREDVKKLVAQRLMIERFISQEYDQEVQKLINKASASLKDIIRANYSNLPNMSVFRKYVGLTNSKRSYWGYSRSLANHSILFLQTICMSVSQEFINLLEQSRQPLIILGIGLYLLRFFIHFLMMMKHILYAAVSEDLSVKKVLKQEMDKRFFTMASDLVWGLVNLLTNYNIFPAYAVD